MCTTINSSILQGLRMGAGIGRRRMPAPMLQAGQDSTSTKQVVAVRFDIEIYNNAKNLIRT